VPAGGGKTIIAASAAALVLGQGEACKFGWLANTTEQCEQAQKACDAAGVSMRWIRCVAGFSTSELAGIDCLILDECHHAATARTWQDLFAYAPPELRIWGFTATPPTDLETRDFFDRLWPDGRETVKREELLESGHLAKGRVVMHDLDRPREHEAAIAEAAKIEAEKTFAKFPFMRRHPQMRKDQISRATWRATLDHLLACPARRAKVVSLATEHAREASVLVLVAEIAQGEALAAEIPGAEVVSGKMGRKKRRDIIDRFRSGALRCLIATSLADEGFDAPIASVLILATYGKSERLLEQRTGRVLRPYPQKDYGLIFDFCDRGAGMAAHHARKRWRVYRGLGYGVEIRG
jgi:superfamily II DNA or RNA helicase